MGLKIQENLLMPSKLGRQCILHRTAAVTYHSIVNQVLLCIGFDGRTDETRLNEGEISRSTKEDYYVIVSFSDGTYVNHVAPQNGKAKDIAGEIMSVIRTPLTPCRL